MPANRDEGLLVIEQIKQAIYDEVYNQMIMEQMQAESELRAQAQ
jgi:hypothetical protein